MVWIVAENPIECRHALLQLEVLGVGEVSPSARLGLRGHAYQPVRIGKRQIPKHQRVEEREDGTDCTDAKTKRDHGGQRKLAVFGEHPDRKAQVLHDGPDDRQPALIAIGFLDLVDAAELTTRRNPCRVGGHASRDVLFRQQIEVRLNLFGEARLAPASQRQVEQTRQEDANAGHDSPSRSPFTIETVRAHSLASAASCFRPAAVIV